MQKQDPVDEWMRENIVATVRTHLGEDFEPPRVDISAGSHEIELRMRTCPWSSPLLSGGDVDAHWEAAESAGDETIGGSCSIPGQSVVDDLGEALGIVYGQNEVMRLREKHDRRDRHRWELDPASSEDFLWRR